MRIAIPGILLALSAIPSLLQAQATGVVVGVVRDSSGAVIAGAAVKASNVLTGLDWMTESSATGRFNFPRLPVGEYKISVTQAGFRTFLSEAFQLEADQNREITATMDVGATSETVTVTGAVSQVDTVAATIRQVVDEKRITELPLNGRNPMQLVLLVPGAVSAPGGA
ncbi:MAG: carboxypeptidase regulatory-like domain-containing protein, partial [Acidobacteriia bacterium]|nr:carboxypeptidase regulatory-like domain-containing protein [Terriglobia bacterium]